MKQLALDLAVPAPPALDNFVAGRNAELVQRLRTSLRARRRSASSTCGASRAAGAVTCCAARCPPCRPPGRRALYVGGGGRVPDAADAAQWVALDDVERLDPEAQLRAFHLYNALRESERRARRRRQRAAGAARRCAATWSTRLAWGLVYQVHALTDEEKAAALAARALALRLPAAARGAGFPADAGAARSAVADRVPRCARPLLAGNQAAGHGAARAELLARERAGTPAIGDTAPGDAG